jgi:hypothetical protein
VTSPLASADKIEAESVRQHSQTLQTIDIAGCQRPDHGRGNDTGLRGNKNLVAARQAIGLQRGDPLAYRLLGVAVRTVGSGIDDIAASRHQILHRRGKLPRQRGVIHG